MNADTGQVAGPSQRSAKDEDFRELRLSGERAGTGYAIGHGLAIARDRIAAGLVRLGATPNGVTTTGFLFTCGAGVCLVAGASHTLGRVPGCTSSWWCFGAFLFLVLAGSCDILDGAVARVGKSGSRFGQVWDSTLDRFSDSVLYLGIIIHFTMVGNVTLSALAALAFIHTYSISYIKARSDNLISSASVGWWQRPERCVGFVTGTLFGHIPALLWQQATLPFFSVLRRLRHTAAVIRAEESDVDPPDTGPFRGLWWYVAIWRHPRGSVCYDIIAAFNIGWTIVAPWIWPFFYGRSDPLRRLLEGWLK
jgi:CDP-diacylglycerol--glycerol-3-phosphate 3-phosphatidyltransferase